MNPVKGVAAEMAGQACLPIGCGANSATTPADDPLSRSAEELSVSLLKVALIEVQPVLFLARLPHTHMDMKGVWL